MREHLREAILGYLFWTLFQSLAPMIWFYPLNELEITGYEAFAVVIFSPFLVSMPFLQKIFRNRWVIALLRLTCVMSLASFQLKSTLSRLMVLAVGCFCVMIIFCLTITNSVVEQRSKSLWGLMSGYMVFVSSRIWYTSFVPAWWNPMSNSVVIAITAIAVVDKISSGDDSLITSSRQRVSSNWFVMGCGLGSLLYLTQALFGDVSLVSRWVVKGYPDHGPMPYPWGAVILLALFVGILVSPYSSIVNSYIWCLIGALSFTAVYLLPTWQGFLGGVSLAVFTMSMWPKVLGSMHDCPPARTLCVAALVWLVEMLFSVWTVAYNFVPGGEYTREHTGWLIVAISISMLLVAATGRSVKVPAADSKITLAKKTVFFLILFTVAGLLGFVSRYQKQTFVHPSKTHPRADFTAAIWTYHFGYDNKGWPSLERTAELLNNTGADVIALLESDASKPFIGNNDLAMWLSEELSMYVDFGPSTRDHTWGVLLLSKYPFVKSVHHLLPSPYGELAPAITATVNMSGKLVDFVATHMGNDRDAIDRDLQARYLASELAQAANPVVFLGYITSAPFSRDYQQLTQHGRVKDIDSTDRERWCEYIMYRGLVRLGFARISHGGLSDTEVQMARFRIPENPSAVVDNDRIVQDPMKVEADVRFSPGFGQFAVGHNYKQNHQYHMSTPKYFV